MREDTRDAVIDDEDEVPLLSSTSGMRDNSVSIAALFLRREDAAEEVEEDTAVILVPPPSATSAAPIAGPDELKPLAGR